jgi:hypothetical protein
MELRKFLILRLEETAARLSRRTHGADPGFLSAAPCRSVVNLRPDCVQSHLLEWSARNEGHSLPRAQPGANAEAMGPLDSPLFAGTTDKLLIFRDPFRAAHNCRVGASFPMVH